ncbi:MAG: FtsQ-type POTRA domain-containing protein [Oscillospiraceae bacterium]|nr:FtsQ-type POTRA domain-containing protein [Oscillospiraceae bacterium]
MTAIFIIAVVTVALSLFFKVTLIEVTGTEVCDQRDIKAASGIGEGDFLLLVNSVAAERGIKAAQPYVENVSIKRRLPGRVIINITETTPLVVISDSAGDYWMVDRRGKLLERARGDALPQVLGVTLLAPVEGTLIAFPSEQDHKVRVLLEVLEAVMEKGLLEDIDSFDLSDIANVKFKFMSRFTVNLGVPNDLSLKLDYIPLALEVPEPNERGVFELSDISSDPTQKSQRIARFIPE